MIQDLRYFLFGPAQDHYKVVILIKNSGLVKEEILKHYIRPIITANPSLKESDFCALNLKYDGKSVKVATTAKPWINFLATLIKCDFIYVTDSAYYKILAGVRKTTYSFGYSVNCVLEPLKNTKVVLSVNYQSLYFNPKNQERISLANACVGLETQGKRYFKDIIKHEEYPSSVGDIDTFLSKLLQYDELACDIEAFSLNHTKAGIATITFAWSQHEGGGFLVDYGVKADTSKLIRLKLLGFFKAYLGAGKKLIWHNISYDAKVLIWELFMQADWGNKTQLLEGLDLLNNPNIFEDTKIIAYLATNSCDGNELGLKQLALPFAGNYALEEIQDITQYEPEVVLKYNLIDSLSTFYVYNEYYPKMVADNQLNIYTTIFKPSVKVLTQAELHGMPLDMNNVLKAEKELTTILQDSLTEIGRNPYVILYEDFKVCDAYISQNLAWKKKYEPLSYFQDFSKTEIHSKTFKLNPNSSTQLSTLLFDLMDLPILDKTKKGQNATGAKTLKDLKNHTNDPDILNFLDALIKYNGAVKILDAFIPSFKNAYHNLDTNTHYLSGNFNLGGTVSGRLSCLTEDAMVHSREGLVKITDIVSGVEVLADSNEYEKVLNTWDNGIAPVFKITLENGHSIEATANHQFLTKNGSYKSIEELTDGIISRNTLVQSKNINSLSTKPDLVRGRNSQRDADQGRESAAGFKRACWYFVNGTAQAIESQFRGSRQSKESDPCSTTNVQQHGIEIYRSDCKDGKSTCSYHNGNNQSKFYRSSDKTERESLQEQSKRSSLFFNRDAKKRNRSDAEIRFGRERIFSGIKARMVYWKNWFKTRFCPSRSNVRTPTNNRNSSRIRSTSCGLRQNQQRYFKSCFTDEGSAFKTTSGFSNIQSIKFMGVKRVYDLEVANRHSYVANGITVHNCSNPNLQQIPSGSIYAKLIKKCFKAPKGKLIVGLDFNSLEDYISALTTKDPNKLKVYTDKYDGHCLRAFGYFPDRLPDIENTVESINSIKDKYPDVRQDSKAPTFALTYQGTWLTLMKNCGFSEKLAKQIESNFKKMYAVSVKYIEDILQKASETGYVEVAFGLRVRTHLIKKSLWGTSKTPKEATAEGRTAGNACGQSYGMLNNRAAIEFQERTLNSKFRERIWPIAHIHDAQYFVVDNNLELLSWMNKNLVECVQWQELPEIQHDEVKLGGELSVFYPDWSNELVIPNGMFDEQELKNYLEAALEKSKKGKGK